MKSPLKNVLFIAFQFPPYGGGSAVHRATRFVRYLGENGWRPHVLTANPRAYEQLDPKMQGYLPADVEVTRAFALDSQRHLSIRGRYCRWLAPSDRWATWTLGAVPAGLSLALRKQVSVILVTFPIATAVLIGLVLHWLTGKPLVVDFRDSMTEDEYPRDPFTRRFNRWIERSVLNRGSRFIFTAPSARQMYLNRYPQVNPAHCVVIQNGYDEEDFSSLVLSQQKSVPSGPFRIVHSGMLYPDDRDPSAFFRAVQRLKADGIAGEQGLRIDLRASGSESYYKELLARLGIDDVVHLLRNLPHREALHDTATADGLLLFQAASCNHQIPAKVYEYIRLNKPILAITSPLGDTASLLREIGGATIADLADEDSIYHGVVSFIRSARAGSHPRPDPQIVATHTRKNGAKQLAKLLDQLLRHKTNEDRSAMPGTVLKSENEQ